MKIAGFLFARRLFSGGSWAKRNPLWTLTLLPLIIHFNYLTVPIFTSKSIPTRQVKSKITRPCATLPLVTDIFVLTLAAGSVTVCCDSARMRVEDRVIPARFLVTLGHLVGVLLVFKTKTDNVYAGLSYDPTIAEVAAAKDDVHVRKREARATPVVSSYRYCPVPCPCSASVSMLSIVNAFVDGCTYCFTTPSIMFCVGGGDIRACW